MKLFILFFTLALSKLSSASEFSYRDTNSWSNHWPACGGRLQSPIDISLSVADYSQQSNKLKIRDFDVVPKAMRLENDGHAVRVIYEWDEKVPTVSGGILTGLYRLHSLIFHWSNKSMEGSEHTYNGTRGIMELQYLLYNTECKSIEEAQHHENGFAIIVDMFFPESISNSSFQSSLVHQLLEQFPQVAHPGSSVNIENRFAILSVAPPGANEFTWIVYPGSLTTPPCTENVMWVVNTYDHAMSEELVRRIQNTVRFSHHDDHNFRDIQPLNGRKQYVTYTEPLV